VLLAEKECTVYVDGEEACRCSSVPMALGLYAVCFYVFNLRFLDPSLKTLMFLQKFAFELTDASKNTCVKRISRSCDAVMEKLAKTSVGALPCRKTSRIKSASLTKARAISNKSVRVDNDALGTVDGVSTANPEVSTAVGDVPQKRSVCARARKCPERLLD